jgi:DNA-binding transcriptional ArsR family regulator
MVAFNLLGQSYARELSRILGSPLSVVQKGLSTLERDGLIAGRLLGRTRLFEVDPRYFAAKELRAYLGRLAAADPGLQGRISTLRRRPRRTGKPL